MGPGEEEFGVVSFKQPVSLQYNRSLITLTGKSRGKVKKLPRRSLGRRKTDIIYVKY